MAPDDAPGLVYLYNALTDGPKTADAAHIHAVIAHPGTTIFGADAKDAIIAIATIHVLPNVTYGGRPYGLIENVVTAPSKRGQGIGKQVMRAAIACAWAQDAYKIMLLTGRLRNALGFYESLGFTGAGKHGLVLRRT